MYPREGARPRERGRPYDFLKCSLIAVGVWVDSTCCPLLKKGVCLLSENSRFSEKFVTIWMVK